MHTQEGFHRYAISAVRVLLAASAMLVFPRAWATPFGSPVCEIDFAGMTVNMTSSVLASPGGWSLQVPPTYSAGSPLAVSVSNSNATKAFRGILLWAAVGGAGGLGNWIVPAGYQNPTESGDETGYGYGPSTRPCLWSLTHATAAPKTQRSFSFNPPAAGSGTIAFRAFLVEDCALPTPDCRSRWVQLGDVLVAEGSGVANYTALWWNPAESGWGINLNHQGNIVFATLFTYDATGAPMWLVMSGGALQSDGTTYAGELYLTTGPAFNASPFVPITAANITRVGSMSVRFSRPDAGTITYTINGTEVTKSIQKQVFGTRPANCVALTASRTALANYQDLWWNPGESGWGVNVTQQETTLFATLFSYDATGKGLWLVMSGGARQADGTFLGDLYQTTGPAFNAQPFTPILAANITKVGTMQFRFTDGNTGVLNYTVNGVAVSKAITRQVFSSPVPSCS